MSGQTLTDRIAAAQYSLTGSEVSRAVCKATTHEQTPPKKKHMECKSSIYRSINLPVHRVLLTLILHTQIGHHGAFPMLKYGVGFFIFWGFF